jgi:Mycoplasma protein of unknown function, DUF285
VEIIPFLPLVTNDFLNRLLRFFIIDDFWNGWLLAFKLKNSMEGMFYSATSFNQSLNDWDVGKVTK